VAQAKVPAAEGWVQGSMTDLVLLLLLVQVQDKGQECFGIPPGQ
jgi:hypothetical protein